MEKLKIKIKNCYGIKSLENEFDFSKGKTTQVIYTPNGVMKTSFAKVFDDYSNNLESTDLIYPTRQSVRDIISDLEVEIPTESVFVIRSYEKSYKSDKISTLLVSEDLRKQYDKIHEKIALEKNKLLDLLKISSGLNKNIEEEFCNSFNQKKNNFLSLLQDLESRIFESTDNNYSHIIFNKIFNERVVEFLETDDIKWGIKKYIEKYDELINKSDILRKDFNHYHATAVQKNLKGNGFFEAEHSINLNLCGKKQEVSNPNEFLKIINAAKEAILQDKELQHLFDKIDKKISNNQLREFREYLFDNQDILTELANLNKFKQNIWLSYLKNNSEEYQMLILEFKKGQAEITDIIKKARDQKTDWENVIEIFNSRFYVPYSIGMQNKEDAVLKDAAPSVAYYFEDKTEKVDEDLLLRVLSQGERRTLYLLNIIFEIESRKKQGLKTLFVIDDIADSFDYKNKYAIIEYLKDVSLHNDFYSIILTHNFDFFRTVQERISQKGKYECSYMALKESDCIKLEELPYRYISNPLKNWKSDFKDTRKLIASITFARNLADYTGDEENFNKLTSILHLKNTTLSVTMGELEEIYKSIFRDLEDLDLEEKNKTVYELLFEVANKIVKSKTDSISNLENKVVISIAIRLNAERFMITKINNDQFVSRIRKNQTGILFGEYKKIYPEDFRSIKVLERVNIMTPENIHLNSFMFEPILDLSDHHLKQLYHDVLSLIEEDTNACREVASTLD